MSEENTRELRDNRSFEDRVFARFDAMERRFDGVYARFEAMDARFDGMDARFDGMDVRFDGLDVRVQALESKALDTKPIWERALAEIVEVREGVYDIKRKFEILTEDLIQVRADQRRVEKRMDTLEARPQ
jgi:archaellum component FlaC